MYSELKKREKLRANEKKKAEKAAAAAAKKAEQAAKNANKPQAIVEETDPAKYSENRRAWVEGQREAGVAYPHKFKRTHRIDECRNEFVEKDIEKGAFMEDLTVAIAGRIQTIRWSGAKLVFIDLEGDQQKI